MPFQVMHCGCISPKKVLHKGHWVQGVGLDTACEAGHRVWGLGTRCVRVAGAGKGGPTAAQGDVGTYARSTMTSTFPRFQYVQLVVGRGGGSGGLPHREGVFRSVPGRGRGWGCPGRGRGGGSIFFWGLGGIFEAPASFCILNSHKSGGPILF